jgi:hypothetical protein
MPTQCILSRYLEEQKVFCLRMGRAANQDTPMGREWSLVVESLVKLQEDHVQGCPRCGVKKR